MSRDGGKYTGEHGAQGQTGGEAIAKQLDRMAAEGGVSSFRAMVVYLTNSAAGQEAMIRAGIDLNNRHTKATVLGWISEPDPTTSTKYRTAVERAYIERRRHNVAQSLKRRLARGGAGTQVEVHPVDQRPVAGPRQRDLGQRRVTIRPQQWEGLVDAWANENTADMDDIWEGVTEESIGSDWAAYSWVSTIGFNA